MQAVTCFGARSLCTLLANNRQHPLNGAVCFSFSNLRCRKQEWARTCSRLATTKLGRCNSISGTHNSEKRSIYRYKQWKSLLEIGSTQSWFRSSVLTGGVAQLFSVLQMVVRSLRLTKQRLVSASVAKLLSRGRSSQACHSVSGSRCSTPVSTLRCGAMPWRPGFPIFPLESLEMIFRRFLDRSPSFAIASRTMSQSSRQT